MSKGPGHIQRSILALIESDPNHGDGAWTLRQICQQPTIMIAVSSSFFAAQIYNVVSLFRGRTKR